jgi:hypothetical protein
MFKDLKKTEQSRETAYKCPEDLIVILLAIYQGAVIINCVWVF